MAYFLLHAGQPSATRLIKKVPRLSRYQSKNGLSDGDTLLRWGVSAEGDPLIGRVLNTREAISRTVKRPAMARFLRKVGIRVAAREGLQTGNGKEPVRFLRHYRIPVFDFSALSVFRADGNTVWLNQRIQRVQDTFREVGINDDKVTARAVHLALRAVHALGLDFGLVSIGMAPKGVLYLQDVIATPVLDGRLLELFTDAVNAYIDSEERLVRNATSNITLGTDVEMMLSGPNGKMVLASRFLPRKGRVGCDDRSVQFDGKRLPLVELRPDPDTTPLGLLHNLRSTMIEASSMINRQNVQWRAGSMPFRPYCTGGHIHFSGVPLSSRLVRCLDNYLGLPLMMVEDPKTSSLRRPKYGFLGDIRVKDYGGFEYRTPASFVVDPDATAAAFCLAYLIALNHRELPLTDIYEPNTQLAFYQGNRDALRTLVMRNIGHIQRLGGYERYKDYLEPLWQMIGNQQHWDENVDIRAVWSVPLSVAKVQVKTRKVARRA